MIEPKLCCKCNQGIDQSKPYYSSRDGHGRVAWVCPRCAGKKVAETPVTELAVSECVPLRVKAQASNARRDMGSQPPNVAAHNIVRKG